MQTFHNDNEVVEAARNILRSRAYVDPESEVFTLDTTSAKGLREYISMEMAGQDTEHFDAFYFEPGGKLIKHVNIANGDEKSVTPGLREVCRQGLLCNATYAVVAHNHPNGDARPSDEDKSSALHTAQALGLVGIHMLAAFVVAGPTADKVIPIPPPEEASKDRLVEMLERMGIA